MVSKRVLYKALCISANVLLCNFFMFATSTRDYAEEPKAPEKIPAATEREPNPGERLVVSINGIEFAFRYCPGGDFTMGCPDEEDDDLIFIEPLIKVRLTHGFWRMETEITQEMWESVMGNNPSRFTGSKRLPVDSISWNDCQRFIAKLNEMNVAPEGLQFALPTEAQWERACRAGTTTPYSWGNSLNGDKANCSSRLAGYNAGPGKALGRTAEVGSYPANPWGLYDMHGNLWEWCSDKTAPRTYLYKLKELTDPTGYEGPTHTLVDNKWVESESDRHMLRGGGWNTDAIRRRSCFRSGNSVDCHSDEYGARLALVESKR